MSLGPENTPKNDETDAALAAEEARIAAMTEEEFFAYLAEQDAEGVLGWDA